MRYPLSISSQDARDKRVTTLNYIPRAIIHSNALLRFDALKLLILFLFGADKHIHTTLSVCYADVRCGIALY